MLNLKELFRFSKTTELQFEEIVFLYSLHDKLENPHDSELTNLFTWYMERFQFFNRNGNSETPIRWVDMTNKLVDNGYIDDLRTEEEKKLTSIHISKFSVTEKFINLLLVKNGKEYWWDFYYETFWLPNAEKAGTSGIPVVLNTTTYILKPDNGNLKYNSIEKIKNVFWDEFCLRGQKDALKEFFSNSEKYLKENGANIKISSFFACYKEMFKKK